MADTGARITQVRSPEDVMLGEVCSEAFELHSKPLSSLACEAAFEPHPGWKGELERGMEHAALREENAKRATP